MEPGDTSYCGRCGRYRQVDDTDEDVVLEGSISTHVEVTHRWVKFACGHEESWPTGARRSAI